MQNSEKVGLAPIIRADCKVLILGSLPGDASLQAGHYYAHPRNALWPILSELLQCPLTELSFEERYQRLLDRRIGLWDVVHSAKRKGSLDSAINDAKFNRLDEFILQQAELALVIFNGQTAAKHGNKYIPTYIQQAVAPSTSPAHTLSFDLKLAQWRAIFSAVL